MATEPGDFKFRDDLVKDEKDTVPIEITIEPYKGVVYRYTAVNIREEADKAVLQFDYELLETGDHSSIALRKDARFQEHLGLVLNHFILEAVDSEHSEDYSEEPDQARTVHT